jgi:TldD protein
LPATRTRAAAELLPQGSGRRARFGKSGTPAQRRGQRATILGSAGALPQEDRVTAQGCPFRDWFDLDAARAERVLAELTARGADHAELYFQQHRAQGISLEDGIVSRASSNLDQGVGLRVVVGDRVGYAFSEDLAEDAMLAAARTAASIAHGGGSTAPQAVALRPHARDYYALPEPWSAVSAVRKLPLLERAEALARAADPSVTRVSVSWGDSEDRVLIVDRSGQAVSDVRPMLRISVQVTCQRGGVLQSHSSNLAARQGLEWLTEERLRAVAREAVERTLLLFEARRPPAGELPVVLAAGASGILLHEAIGHGLEADANRKGTSIYSTLLGQRIAPEFVSIVDDGTLAHERGALNCDDEGTPSERSVLVENGVLRSYLHDRISAAHYKVPSTGSGRRESFRCAPLPRMRCTYMLDGPHTREEVIAAVKGTGIVAETFTNGQVQIGAGDFTFYIKNGWLIENGRITAPIKDVNIIGNGPEALRRVQLVAGDGKLDGGGWTCGKDGQSVPVSQGMPTVLVSHLSVGGASA